MRWFVMLALARIATAQIYPERLPLDHAAIHYFNDSATDPIALLQQRLDRGTAKLAFSENGYLPALLEELGINIDTQALVFSKTSFQSRKISPRNPRAIYFDDNVAVGFVRGGDEIELASLDPMQGIIFYTLSAAKAEQPRFVRRRECLRCHQGPSTIGVPGIFIGSVYPGPTGSADRTGAIITDHRTPFADRWGGWYVNASAGQQKDRANAIAPDPAEPHSLDVAGRQNLQAFTREFSSAGYLSPVSDIVALMTYEHQTQAANLITRLGWHVRLESSQVDSDIEELARYLTFDKEAPLAEPVRGVSSFTETFPARGPKDRQGRSLRDFDLRTRLFRYPLSYMIYSPAFNALPDAIRARVYKSIDAKLPLSTRREILEILRDTKPDYTH
jgi:hypothetical protein